MLTQAQEEKARLRARFLQARAALVPEERAARDAEILARVLMLPEYASCKTLYTYVSKAGEIATQPLIQAAWANGRQVAVPCVLPEHGEMEFRLITGWNQLIPGRFRLLEPMPDCPVADPTQPGNLCIVPGLCFDAGGYRIGYGGGYYDRYLIRFCGSTVGLCCAAAVLLKLPGEPTDRPVDILVTEQFVRRTGGCPVP